MGRLPSSQRLHPGRAAHDAALQRMQEREHELQEGEHELELVRNRRLLSVTLAGVHGSRAADWDSGSDCCWRRGRFKAHFKRNVSLAA